MSIPVTDVVLDPAADATLVSYPAGELTRAARIVGLARVPDSDGGLLGVVLDATAAHPLSPTWPDQPADRGTLESTGGTHTLLDVRQAVLHDGTLTLDTSASRVPGREVVVHLIDASADLALSDRVLISVDGPWRRSLSLAHSACHLSALALDAALAGFWTKPVATDPLGRPAFDQIAIASSTLHPHRAVDVHRLGRSLRKKGFDATRLVGELDVVTAAHADTLRRWVEDDTPARVDAGDGTLSARRRWCGTLDGVEVAIPCGGTHVFSTGELIGIGVQHLLSDARDELTVTTTVSPG